MTHSRSGGCTRRAACLGLLLAAAPAWTQPAAPAELAAELPGARLQGSGLMRFLGLRVYEVRLWAPAPVAAADDGWAAAPLALEIVYERALVGRLIAERSLDEMRRQGPLPQDQASRWLAAMTELFPDVKEGDRITGVQRPREAARFFVNGRFKGEVRDAEFTRRFFGIWLSPQTSEAALREALLSAGAR